MLLSRVGYWRPLRSHLSGGKEDASLPDPRYLVDTAWNSDRKRLVSSYLKSGRIWAHEFGYSYCRFQCGIEDYALGSNDLTDGTWLWPEGLWHYVEAHSVGLPVQFLDHLRDRGYRHLTDLEFANLGELDGGVKRHTAAELYACLVSGKSGRYWP